MLRPLLCLALLMTPGCAAGGLECTEVDCNNEAVVTYPSGLVSGPYSLTLSQGGEMETFACNDPETAADLPAEVTRCDASGFELIDSRFGVRSTVTVTLADPDGNLIAGPTEVVLSAVETLQPNGPDCEPTCIIRNGRFM